MIFITGASAGIGQSCAELLAEAGHDLILTARRKDRLEALATRLREKHGRQVHVFSLDVSDREAVEAFTARESALLSQVKVLVNNAGLAVGRGKIQDGRLADFDVMMNTNVKGLLYVTRQLLPFLLAQSEAHIVNMGSVAGRWIYPMGNVYCATKAAVHALSQALRMDLSGSRVRVTEISPGMVETEFSEVRFGDKAKAKAVYAGMTPLTARDIAEAIVWCLARPSHVCIQEMVIYPTCQASPSIVARTT